jgi:hypothetical protein
MFCIGQAEHCSELSPAMILFYPLIRAVDENGDPVPFARLYAFEAGTTTATTVFTDVEGEAPAEIPVVANASGQFPPLFSTASVKIDVRDSDDNSLPGFPVDSVALPNDGRDGSTSVAILADSAALRTYAGEETLIYVSDPGAFYKTDGTTGSDADTRDDGLAYIVDDQTRLWIMEGDWRDHFDFADSMPRLNDGQRWDGLGILLNGTSIQFFGEGETGLDGGYYEQGLESVADKGYAIGNLNNQSWPGSFGVLPLPGAAVTSTSPRSLARTDDEIQALIDAAVASGDTSDPFHPNFEVPQITVQEEMGWETRIKDQIVDNWTNNSQATNIYIYAHGTNDRVAPIGVLDDISASVTATASTGSTTTLTLESGHGFVVGDGVVCELTGNTYLKRAAGVVRSVAGNNITLNIDSSSSTASATGTIRKLNRTTLRGSMQMFIAIARHYAWTHGGVDDLTVIMETQMPRIATIGTNIDIEKVNVVIAQVARHVGASVFDLAKETDIEIAYSDELYDYLPDGTHADDRGSYQRLGQFAHGFFRGTNGAIPVNLVENQFPVLKRQEWVDGDVYTYDASLGAVSSTDVLVDQTEAENITVTATSIGTDFTATGDDELTEVVDADFTGGYALNANTNDYVYITNTLINGEDEVQVKLPDPSLFAPDASNVFVGFMDRSYTGTTRVLTRVEFFTAPGNLIKFALVTVPFGGSTIRVLGTGTYAPGTVLTVRTDLRTRIGTKDADVSLFINGVLECRTPIEVGVGSYSNPTELRLGNRSVTAVAGTVADEADWPNIRFGSLIIRDARRFIYSREDMRKDAEAIVFSDDGDMRSRTTALLKSNGGAFTITITDAPENGDYWRFVDKDGDTPTNNVTISDGTSTVATIDAVGDFILSYDSTDGYTLTN